MRELNHKADARSDGTLTSIMVVLVSVLQNSETVLELAALSAAALTIAATLSMMMCATAASLLRFESSALNKWRVNTKALRHIIPTTSICWYNLTPTMAAISPAIGAVVAGTVCYLVFGAWCSVLTASTTVHAARASTSAWHTHWTGIYQNSRLRAKYTAAYVYLDTKVPDGVVRRKYLLDLGAAASVIPLSAFFTNMHDTKASTIRSQTEISQWRWNGSGWRRGIGILTARDEQRPEAQPTSDS